MRSKKVEISIPKPCHEKWVAMQENEIGKFCFSCQKTVVDFTQKTDTEIAAILLQNQDKVCGRLYQSQLKTIYLTKPQIRTSHFRTYLLALTNVVLAGCLLPTHAEAQTPIEVTKKDYVKEFLEKEKRINSEKAEKLVIIGNVKSKYDKLNLAGVTIFLKGTNQGAVTDNEGNFQLKINDISKDSIGVICTSYIGYLAQEIKISKSKKNGTQYDIIALDIDLEEDNTGLIGEIIIIESYPLYKRLYNKVKNWLRF